MFIFVQASDYINALLVPRDGQILTDVQCLATQGIFHVVSYTIPFYIKNTHIHANYINSYLTMQLIGTINKFINFTL